MTHNNYTSGVSKISIVVVALVIWLYVMRIRNYCALKIELKLNGPN